MRHFLCLGLGLLLGVTWAFGQAQPEPAATSSRVAVVGTADTADFTALLTAELSSSPAIALVERNDLAKVGDEAKLQQLANQDAIALGKLVGADGLIFVNKSADGIQVRFTSAGLGYALFDDRYATTADLPHLALVIARRVSGYAPKLKLRPQEAIPLSILNLRTDVAATDPSDVERKLTLLLESRLASIPKVVILERRHGSALRFERTLSSSSQAPLQGVSLVDGTLTLPPKGRDDIAAHLRLRPFGGQPVDLEVHGSIKDLPALGEAMATAIGAKLKVTADVAWQPQSEAKEYYLEGVWGAQHSAETAALEALDSAELLGFNLADVIYVRVPVLCGVAAGTANIMTADHRTPDDPQPEARVEAMLRALAEETRYEKENMTSQLQESHPDSWQMGNIQLRRSGVARAAGSLLTMLDARNYPHCDPIRTAFREFAGYDPLHGKLPEDVFLSIRYADSLSETEEEEKAYYRILLASPSNSIVWRMVEGSLSRDTYCARFYPKVDGHTHARYIAYLEFLKSLQDGPCRLNALLGYAGTIIPPQMQEDACKAYYQALTDQRENLFATNQLAPYLSAAFSLEKQRGVDEADPQVIALLHFLLQKSGQVDGHISEAWVPELFPSGEAPVLWKEFQALEAKSASTDPLFISQMRRKYLSRFGNAEVVPGSLEVNRFWYPPHAEGKPNFARKPALAAPNGIWMAAWYLKHESRQEIATGVFYRVALDGSHGDLFATETFQIPGFDPNQLAVTSSALYVIGSPWKEWKKTLLQRFDLSAQRFEKYEVPTSRDIFEVGGTIYLGLCGTGLAGMEGGLARWDGKTGETTLLASSRRRPAQNQFDDRSNYTVRSVFAGSGGKPWASMGFGEVYSVEDKPGPWPRVIPSGGLMFSETVGSRTLLYGRQMGKGEANPGDTVFLVDSTKPNPVLWLGSPGSLLGTEMMGKAEPLPQQPEWSQHPLWQQPPEDGPYSSRYGLCGDDLFCFIYHIKTQQRELLWYRQGQMAPVRVPLNFKLSDEAAKATKAMEEADDDPLKKERRSSDTSLDLFCTPQGLCFIESGKGFWFLPFNDIKAHLKADPH